MTDNNIENAFEAPQAELHTPASSSDIKEFKRFSAWAVFFLNIITLTIYGMYWLYSRGKQINEYSKEAKVNMSALYGYLILAVSINFIDVLPLGQDTLNGLSIIATILYIVLYVLAVFSMRKALAEIINKGSAEPVKIGGVRTFFFSFIYFQYVINKTIDTLSSGEEPNTSIDSETPQTA